MIAEFGYQIGFDGGPFGVEDAVEDGITDETVRQDHMLAQNTFFNSAESLNGMLGAQVAGVGFELYAYTAKLLKGVSQQQIFAFGVDRSALVGDGIPGTTDLDGEIWGVDVEVAGGSNGVATLKVDHSEG